MIETEHDAEIPDGPADDGPATAMPDQPEGDTAEEQARGKIVDAAAGHQADKPTVEGDPKDEPNPDPGTEPAADFE